MKQGAINIFSITSEEVLARTEQKFKDGAKEVVFDTSRLDDVSVYDMEMWLEAEHYVVRHDVENRKLYVTRS